MDEFKTILSLVKEVTVTALVIVALVGGMRGLWVWGWQYRKECERGDKWEKAYLDLRASLDKALTALQEAVEVIRRKGS